MLLGLNKVRLQTIKLFNQPWILSDIPNQKLQPSQYCNASRTVYTHVMILRIVLTVLNNTRSVMSEAPNHLPVCIPLDNAVHHWWKL